MLSGCFYVLWATIDLFIFYAHWSLSLVFGIIRMGICRYGWFIIYRRPLNHIGDSGLNSFSDLCFALLGYRIVLSLMGILSNVHHCTLISGSWYMPLKRWSVEMNLIDSLPDVVKVINLTILLTRSMWCWGSCTSNYQNWRTSSPLLLRGYSSMHRQ